MTRDFIGHAHDFDFLVGRWHVANRRLRQRLVGSSDWESFDAVSQAWVHLDGQVSVDEIAFEGKPFKGCTFRTLDVEAKRWEIYWIMEMRRLED
jgi:predicted HD phosphohydrolase